MHSIHFSAVGILVEFMFFFSFALFKATEALNLQMKSNIATNPTLFRMLPFQAISKKQDHGLLTEDKWGIGHLTFFPETHKSGFASTLNLLLGSEYFLYSTSLHSVVVFTTSQSAYTIIANYSASIVPVSIMLPCLTSSLVQIYSFKTKIGHRPKVWWEGW